MKIIIYNLLHYHFLKKNYIYLECIVDHYVWRTLVNLKRNYTSGKKSFCNKMEDKYSVTESLTAGVCGRKRKPLLGTGVRC